MLRPLASPRRTAALIAALVVSGAGCASYDLVHLPQRKADLYPHADQNRDVWVAVDAITQARRAQRFFGANLPEQGIHPIEIVVTNHGRERVRVGPADVFLVRGGAVIDPIPLGEVTEVVTDRLGIVTAGTRERIGRFLEDLSFREIVIGPGQSYHGVMFFDVAALEPGPVSRFFRVARLYPEPSYYLTAAVTDLDRGRRIGFGPFGLHHQP